MTEQVKDETKFTNKFLHVGVVVRDMEKAIERLESLGIGPFKPFNRVVRQDTKLYGRSVDPDDVKLRIKLADIGGGVKIEVIQPLGGGPGRISWKLGVKACITLPLLWMMSASKRQSWFRMDLRFSIV